MEICDSGVSNESGNVGSPAAQHRPGNTANQTHGDDGAKHSSGFARETIPYHSEDGGGSSRRSVQDREPTDAPQPRVAWTPTDFPI